MSVQQNLRVAQLVERKTVRVALYLEVACSTQALEIPFCLPLDLRFADRTVYSCFERNHHSETCGIIFQLSIGLYRELKVILVVN